MAKDTDTVLLAKGVDTLYVHLRPSGIDWKAIYEQADKIDFDEVMAINDLQFVKKKQWVGRHYPMCLQHSQFRFFINRQSAYIKASSLGFEMRGYEGMVQWLCRILDRLLGGSSSEPWLDLLRVSRIDVYADFIFDGDFKIEQFSTRLRTHGLFQSGKEAEGKTLYFGNRKFHDLFIRLYVKNVEVKESGKTYLESSWRESGHDGKAKIWRLEFEYHKQKIEEICQFRELIAVDVNALDRLWSHGINAIKYVNEWVDNGNLSKQPLHPVWQALHDALFKEYSISKKQYKRATALWWFQRIRNSVISWLVTQDYSYDDLPAQYIRDFSITEEEYQKALNREPFAFPDWEPEFLEQKQIEVGHE